MKSSPRFPEQCRRWIILAATMATIAWAAAGHAQGPKLQDRSTKPAPAKTAAMGPVDVPVVVLDRKGNPVPNLTQDDFVLQVDQKAQPIQTFNHDANAPLTIGILIDASMDQRDALEGERKAAKAFVDGMLTDTGKTKAFVVQFARQTDLLQDVTPSTPKLDVAIQQIETVAGSKGGSKDSESGVDTVGRNSSATRGNTTFNDALFLSADEVLKDTNGLRVLIVVSDGVDHGSKEGFNSALETAERANAVVYTIYFKGRTQSTSGFHRGQIGTGYPGGYPGDCSSYPGGGYPGGGYPGGYPGRYPGGYPGGSPGDPCSGPSGIPETKLPTGKKTMQKLANDTGGHFFEASHPGAFGEIFERIAEELHATYRLGFTPDKAGSQEGYHQLDVSLKNADPKQFAIQSRDGYYGSQD